jgi:hypothetical protein
MTTSKLVKSIADRYVEAKGERVYVTRVKLDAQGYDSCGCYWGVDQPLYRYCSEYDWFKGAVRAADREAAKRAIALMPQFRGLKFFR